MNRWQRREKKLQRRRYGMRVDGQNVRSLMLALLYRQKGLDSGSTMVEKPERSQK